MKRVITLFSDNDTRIIINAINDAITHQIHLTNEPTIDKEDRIAAHGIKNEYLALLVKFRSNTNDLQSNNNLRKKIHAISNNIVIIDPSGIIYGAERETEQRVSRSRSDNNRNSKVSVRNREGNRPVQSRKKHKVHSKNSKRSPKKVR